MREVFANDGVAPFKEEKVTEEVRSEQATHSACGLRDEAVVDRDRLLRRRLLERRIP